MYDFKTNDDVTLKYIDTGAEGDEDENEGLKPWLLLVSNGICFLVLFSFFPHERGEVSF